MSSSSKPDLVVFSKTDPDDPKNWSCSKKRLVCVHICALAYCAIFGSSIYAPSELQIRLTYGVSAVTASSGLTLYVLGFSLGPLLCPMSEMYGRRFPYMVSWPLLIFTSGISAWVNNLPVILVFRFLAGSCAGCAVNNGGGIMSDMYNIVDMQAQAVAISWYAVCIFAGSCTALPSGFFIAVYAAPHLWPLRVFFFFVIAMWPLVLFLPESHGPTILAARSKKLRKQGRPNARAAHEMKHQTKTELFKSHIGRPAGMFYREPIIQGAALWTSLAYGILYLYFELYPAVFFLQHHFQLQYTGLPFLALVLGILAAALPYLRLVRLFQSLRMPSWIVPPGVAGPETPESRLKLALFACCLMPVSLFWFAWTSGGETHWIVPTLAGVPLGFAVITIFFTFLTFTSQTYTIYAASASACNTFARSLVGAIFPVASHSIVRNLGTKWGVSLLGFLSLTFIPITFAFLRYGGVLRARSPYAREANGIVAKMRAQAQAPQLRPPPPAAKTGETESKEFLMPPPLKEALVDKSDASEKTSAVLGWTPEEHVPGRALRRMSADQVTGKTSLEHMLGKVSLEQVSGKAMLEQVLEKASLEQVPGKVSLQQVSGKTSLEQESGRASLEQVPEITLAEQSPETTPAELVLETTSTELVPETTSAEQVVTIPAE